MKPNFLTAVAGLVLLSVLAAAQSNGGQNGEATGIAQLKIAKIVPGRSTKGSVRSLLGAPWRIVQFNDCGMAMDDQADETWEYRKLTSSGGYRVHIEFGENGVVHLIAKIPENVPGGKATAAKIAPTQSPGMSM